MLIKHFWCAIEIVPVELQYIFSLAAQPITQQEIRIEDGQLCNVTWSIMSEWAQ